MRQFIIAIIAILICSTSFAQKKDPSIAPKADTVVKVFVPFSDTIKVWIITVNKKGEMFALKGLAITSGIVNMNNRAEAKASGSHMVGPDGSQFTGDILEILKRER